jgi:hypothetical protein
MSVFETDTPDQYVAEIHTGPIHWYDKLSTNQWRTIDTTWQAITGGWEMKEGPLHITVPDFADGWIEIRDIGENKDQTTRIRPVASNVAGSVVGDSIEYPDAFGTGLDLVLEITGTGEFRKLIRMADANKGTVDIDFDFEVEWPEGMSLSRQDPALTGGYALSLNSDKIFDTNKQLVVGNELTGGKDPYTVLRQFLVWDSSSDPIGETIEVTHLNSAGKWYLRKHITGAYLTSSTGDVFTDVTFSTNVSTNDQTMELNNSSSQGIYNGDTCYLLSLSSGLAYCGRRSTTYEDIAFLPFDTSSIPDTIIISSVAIGLHRDTGTGSSVVDKSIVALDESGYNTTTGAISSATTVWDAWKANKRNFADFAHTSITTTNNNRTDIALSDQSYSYIKRDRITAFLMMRVDIFNFDEDTQLPNLHGSTDWWRFNSGNATSVQPRLQIVYSDAVNHQLDLQGNKLDLTGNRLQTLVPTN